MSETTVPIEELLAERDWLCALAHRLVADAGTADDLVQETWVTALTRPPRHRRGLRGWLATVLRNRAHDARERARRELRRAERSTPAGPPDDPADVVARAELEQRVARLTLALPEPYRGTLLLRYHRGLSPKEIAEMTAVPPGTVRSRLKRGLELLRARLDGDHDADRRAWVLALLPLARRARPLGGTLMLNLPMKAAMLLAVLVLAGSGTAVILAGDDSSPATPPPVRAEISGSPAAPQRAPVGADEAPPPNAPENGRERDESPLDRRIDLKLEGTGLAEALDEIRNAAGLQYELRPPDLGRDTSLTLTVEGMAVRDVLTLLAAMGCLAWEEQSDGFVVLHAVPAPPPASTPARPWFGGPHGRFPAPAAVEGQEAPPIALPQADMGRTLTAETLRSAIQVIVGPDGSAFVNGDPLAGEYALWLALLDRPDAPVAVFADARAPFAKLVRIRALAPDRDVRLALSRGAALPLPETRMRDDVPTIRFFTARKPADPDAVYRQLWRVRAANREGSFRVTGSLPKGSTVADGVLMMNEAERFGFLLSVDVSRSPMGPASREFRIVPPRGFALAEGTAPERRSGVAVGSLPAVAAAAPAPWSTRFLNGRGGRRNLRAGGGGGTQGAVDLGLTWLAGAQREDGSWSGDAEETALALLAFLATGEVGHGTYGETVTSGLDWLEASGDAGGSTTTALAEAWALTADPRWRRAAASRASRTRSALALRVARLCGVPVQVPREVDHGTDTMGCFLRILDGETPARSESLATALNAFILPTKDHTAALAGASDELIHDGALAAFQAGGTAWTHWNRAMKAALVETQVRDGEEAGSWDPPEGGSRIRTTALRVASLTVYYRYPRLFDE